MLKTHNKKPIPLLNLLANCILARTAPQVLSVKDEYTFRFLKLKIGLHYSSVDCWVDIISFLTAPLKADLLHTKRSFYQKKL